MSPDCYYATTSRHLKNVQARAGAATIEFVFALPILITLIVGMTWLGFFVIHQAEVNVISRHHAWNQRHENSAATAFVFTANPTYRGDDDWTEGESNMSLDFHGAFENFPDPNAKQIVMAGSWDHRTLPLDELPNWNAYALAVINAETGDLQNLLAGIGNFREIVADAGTNFIRNQIGFTDLINGESSQAESNQLANTDEQASSNEDQIRRLTERKQELDAEIAPLERIKERRNLTLAQERKLFRLEAEAKDVDEDLDELRNAR